MSERRHDPKDETDTDAIEDLDVGEEAEEVRGGDIVFEDEEPTAME